MLTLYIIGNGFDLAHNLKTGYKDFRSFLDKYHPEFLYQFEKLYDIEPLDSSEYGYSTEAQKRWDKRIADVLWNEFEDKIGHPNIGEMMNFSECILNDLDLETGNVGIEDTMDEYWKEEYGFINKFPKYVKEWISTIDTSVVEPLKRSLINNDHDLFFCFNYTNTLENVYKNEDVFHIHGSVVSGNDIDPIMGHCNIKDIDEHTKMHHEAQEEYEEGESSIHNAISNYLQILYKDTHSIVRQNEYYFQSLKNVNQVIIVGWAAGDVDIPYLLEIKKHIDKDSKWLAYYFDEDARTSIENAFEITGIASSYEIKYEPTTNFWD